LRIILYGMLHSKIDGSNPAASRGNLQSFSFFFHWLVVYYYVGYDDHW